MGPISEVSIIFPFLESGNPKPLIIVGENGTGKTTLLSNVVDSLYELAGKAFHDVTESDGGSGHQYFKAISPSEIQIGQNYMYSVVESVLSVLVVPVHQNRTHKLMHHAFKTWCIVSTSGRFSRLSGCNDFRYIHFCFWQSYATMCYKREQRCLYDFARCQKSSAGNRRRRYARCFLPQCVGILWFLRS